MEKDELKNKNEANNSNSGADNEKQEHPAFNPFEDKDKQLTKEEEENIELFKEAQTERD